ncbi:EF-hand domain-containing protein, partial [Sphingosinicella sp.]|uniref:EF-hand domain-containing protein n=1 Tax=Sphingosinicella sp. TaxID=1917971 RepID=UPI0040378FC2
PPGPGRLFVSPSGEVFRSGEGARPLQAWFALADADHDGAITYAELRADFARAFAGFDTDGDGEIEPADVARYETEILPEMGRFGFRPGGGAGFGPAMRRGRLDRDRRGGGGMRRRDGGGHWAMMAGAARFGLLPITHPIMDADADFNRGVTRAEFDAAAGRRFNQLNATGSGRLTLEDLVSARRQLRRGDRDGDDD